MPTYDLIVIGTGPGGYVCAIRAAQLGMNVAVVEKDKNLRRHLPQWSGAFRRKAMLHASELFDEAGHAFGQDGIKVGTPALDLPTMLKFKTRGVTATSRAWHSVPEKTRSTPIIGVGRIAAPGKGEVKAARRATNTIEAKGDRHCHRLRCGRLKASRSTEADRVVDGALSLGKVPQRLLVVGPA